MSGEWSGEPGRRDDTMMDELRKDIKTLLINDASKTEVLERIENQVKKTNGRVDTLEKSHNDLKDEHKTLVNRAIGWATGAGVVVGALWKIFK